MKNVAPLLLGIAFTFSSSLTMAFAEVELAYHPQAGSEWTMLSVIDAEVPFVGNKHLAVSYDLTCADSDADGSNLTLRIPQVDIDGTVIGPVDASFALSPWGDVSRMESSQLDDSLVGPLLRNVGMIFPKLPGGVVSAGAGWTAREVLHLHELGKMKLPTKIRLDGGFNYLGTVDGKEEISISYKEADGDVKVRLDGKCYYDVDSGVITHAGIKGTIKVKRFFQWFTIPISIKSEKK